MKEFKFFANLLSISSFDFYWCFYFAFFISCCESNLFTISENNFAESVLYDFQLNFSQSYLFVISDAWYTERKPSDSDVCSEKWMCALEK